MEQSIYIKQQKELQKDKQEVVIDLPNWMNEEVL